MKILKRIKHKTWESMKKIWKIIKFYMQFYTRWRNIKFRLWLMVIKIRSKTWIIAYKAQHIFGKAKERILKLAPYKLLSVLLILSIAIVLYFLYINWISAPEFWKLVEIDDSIKLEVYSQIVRNRGWLIWMVISFFGLLVGIGLTTWGRIIQHKSHLHERLEKATTMLGSQAMSMRITGCRLLMSLATDDKNMKSLCVRLLFSFINNPYLKEADEDKDPDDLFSDTEKHLRPDIQSAVNSYFTIYNHYGDKEIDDKLTDLPAYFWKNRNKAIISLIKANLSNVDLQGAYLYKANLRKADLDDANLQEAYLYKANLREASLFDANFQGADLIHANFQGANLMDANLQGAILQDANLQGANLMDANLQGANLMDANLQGANLMDMNLQEAELIDANLQGTELFKANFQGANLRHADITDAEMNFAKKLTKKQILSAIWGIDEEGKGSPPSLPDELEADPEVKKWLATPYYNKSKKE